VGGSLYILDSTFYSTTIAIFINSRNGATLGEQWQITLDNIAVKDVVEVVFDVSSQSYLAGGTTTIDSWTIGRIYDTNNPNGVFTSGETLAEQHPKTDSLYANGHYFERSKPQYAAYAADYFLNAKLLLAGKLSLHFNYPKTSELTMAR
jgi:glucan 1,3-beta-glucosidase